MASRLNAYVNVLDGRAGGAWNSTSTVLGD